MSMLPHTNGEKIKAIPIRPTRHDRTAIYQGIARLLWLQYALENDMSIFFDQAPADFKVALLELAEPFANMALSPDMRDAALGAMADHLCRSSSAGTLTLRDVSRPTAQSYLATAEAALQALLLNLKTHPMDPHYRDSISRLIDAIAPKQGVM